MGRWTDSDGWEMRGCDGREDSLMRGDWPEPPELEPPW